MRKYGTTPEEDEVLTYRQYLIEVKAKRSPGLIEYLERLMKSGGLATGLNPELIRIERITSMKSRDYWSVKFFSGTLSYEFSAYASADKSIYAPRELLVRNPEEGVTTKYEFSGNGATSNVTTFRESPMTYASKARGLVNLDPLLASAPDIKFFRRSQGVMGWKCLGCPRDSKWCVHLHEYWAERRDANDISSITCSAGRPLTLQYVLPGGYFVVDVTIESIKPEALGLAEDEPPMMRLSYGENLSVWMEPDTSGMAVVQQLIDMVKVSKHFMVWHDRGRSFMQSTEKCRNKYHSPKDTRKFNAVVTNLAASGTSEELGNFVFANAFSDYFLGRCIPCTSVLRAMKDDVPNHMGGSITGPATKYEPF